jgi:Ca2+-binding RTX toxin-like protein
MPITLVPFSALSALSAVNNPAGQRLRWQESFTAENAEIAEESEGDRLDSVVVNGTSHADMVQISGSGTSFAVAGLRTAIAVQGSEGATDALIVNTLAGNDSVTAAGLPAGVVQLQVDGGTGNDTVIGSDGDDRLVGGDGNDLIIGGRGADEAFLGNGNDTFVWNPGDGSDFVEGQGGNDTLQFNGANLGENIDLSANGSRLRLFRDVGTVTMDVNGVEQVNVDALGGADTVTVNDLSGTGVANVNIDLAGALGGRTGDGAADTVIVNGTPGADAIKIAGAGSSVVVAGLSATVHVANAEGANDSLRVNGLGGNDRIDASGLHAGVIALTLDGGAGDDTLIGSAGNDLIIGGTGSDVAFLGAGDDTFVWNPGDGSDVVEGQGGRDTLQFNGANIDEKIDLSANGGRLRLTRDVGTVTMDVNGVEQVNVVALGGADTITVNDLTGTGVTDVNVDLAATPAGSTGDGQADNVIVNGTAGDDHVKIAANAGTTNVQGLAATVHIAGADPASDRVTINAKAGDDLVNASHLAAGVIQLTADGGDGDDVLVGSAGDDILVGDAGDDIVIGGPGQDALDGGPGDNTVVQ